MINSAAERKATIRKQTRQLRQQLSQEQQQTAAENLIKQVEVLPAFDAAKQVALYLTNDSELDTTPLIELCWKLNKHVYLPVIHPFASTHLLFIQYSTETTLKANKFGIPEPQLDVTQLIPISQLDIIFTPLVAFDNHLNRLGMGGGFYDRTLAPLKNTQNLTEIYGLAHECQKVDQLTVEPWDLPMNAIVTDEKIYRAISS